MALKKFKDVGNTGFTKGWRDNNKDKFIQFKPGETKELRFIDCFMEMMYHWVPFMSKKQGRMSMFPQECLKHSVFARTDEEAWNEEAECPACDLALQVLAHGIFPVIDVELLYEGDGNPIRYIDVGPRERQKLEQLRKFNKVQGTPTDIADSRYGKIIQIVNDPKNKDPALRWQFNTGSRLPLKFNDKTSTVRIVIPDTAESDYRGKEFKFIVEDMTAMVVYPTAHELRSKYERMHVADAMVIYEENQRKRKKEQGDEDNDYEEDRPRSKKRKNEDEEETSPRVKRRKERVRADLEDLPRRKKRPADDDDDDDEDDVPVTGRRDEYDDDEDIDDAKPSKRQFDDEDDEDLPRGKSRKDEDDEGDDDEDEKPKSSRRRRALDDDDSPPSRKKSRVRDDEDDDDDEEEDNPRKKRPKDDDDDSDEDEDKPKSKTAKNKCLKDKKGNKCPLHKDCYGRMGDSDTEDCTLCAHRKACHKRTQSDGEE